MAKFKRTFLKLLVATGMTSLLSLILQTRAEESACTGQPRGMIEIVPEQSATPPPGVMIAPPVLSVTMGKTLRPPQKPIASLLLPVIGGKTADAYMADVESSGRLPPGFSTNPLLSDTNDLLIVVIKDTGRVEVHACDRLVGQWTFDAQAGTPARKNRNPGPKFVSGDGRIPEGVYGLSIVNTTALHGPALQLDYPNKDDMADARADGRLSDDGTVGDLGGDVCFRGGVKPGSCIPLGADIDRFAYAVLRSRGNGSGATIVIAPYDMRNGRRPELEKSEFGWYQKRCDKIEAALKRCPPPDAIGTIRDFPRDDTAR